jgi:hypothetical protein
MVAGMAMGIQQNFTLAPAHAHLNLVGGVLLFLFGLYYRLVPAAGNSTLARIQGTLHILGGLVLPAGIALTLLNNGAYFAAPAVGSAIVVVATLLFAVVLFRTERT